jgi:hypothetical protein
VAGKAAAHPVAHLSHQTPAEAAAGAWAARLGRRAVQRISQELTAAEFAVFPLGTVPLADAGPGGGGLGGVGGDRRRAPARAIALAELAAAAKAATNPTAAAAASVAGHVALVKSDPRLRFEPLKRAVAARRLGLWWRRRLAKVRARAVEKSSGVNGSNDPRLVFFKAFPSLFHLVYEDHIAVTKIMLCQENVFLFFLDLLPRFGTTSGWPRFDRATGQAILADALPPFSLLAALGKPGILAGRGGGLKVSDEKPAALGPFESLRLACGALRAQRLCACPLVTTPVQMCPPPLNKKK